MPTSFLMKKQGNLFLLMKKMKGIGAKIYNELRWIPKTDFVAGIKKTIKWYLDNKEWWEEIISGEYRNYYKKMYANR